MPNQKLTNEIIIAAIEGFEAQKFRIDSQIADLRGMLDGNRPEPAVGSEPKKVRRKMSAAARKRIAAAQRKRWAEAKKQAETPEAKPKRKLSAAGKAAIVAALRKRWAAKKAEAAKPKPAITKKSAPKRAAGRKAVAKKSSPLKSANKRSTAKKALTRLDRQANEHAISGTGKSN